MIHSSYLFFLYSSEKIPMPKGISWQSEQIIMVMTIEISIIMIVIKIIRVI